NLRHQCGTGALDRVRAGAPAPLAAPQIPVDEPLAERPEAHPRACHGRALLLPQQQREAADDFVRFATQRAQHLARRPPVARLAVELPVQCDDGVACEHPLAAAALARRARLAQRILERYLARLALYELLYVLRADLEGDAQALEQRAPLR